MKDVLLTNFTKYDLDEVKEFIRRHNLYNAYAVIPNDAVNEETKNLILDHGLNVIVPVDCTEKGPNGIPSILRRNPKFLEHLAECIPQKVFFLRESKVIPGGDSVIALSLNYDYQVIMLRSTERGCSYFQDAETVTRYTDAFGDDDINEVMYLESLAARFDVVDYGLLKTIGVLGGTDAIS